MYDGLVQSRFDLHWVSSRVRFMLDVIAAIKTNNTRKIPNYDPSLLEHKRRVLRGLASSSTGEEICVYLWYLFV